MYIINLMSLAIYPKTLLFQKYMPLTNNSQSPGPKTPIINPIKLETGLRPNSAGIPYTLLLRIEAMGFPTFGLLL